MKKTKKYHGFFPAIVVNSADPLLQGRVQVRVPQLHGDVGLPENVSEKDLPWAVPCFSYLGHNSGILFVPEIGVGVFVFFLQGDIRTPVYIGSWLSASESVSEFKSGYAGKPTKYVIETPLAGKLIFAEGKDRKVRLEDKENQGLLIDTPNKLVRVQSNGDLEFKATNDLSTTVQNNKRLVVAGTTAITLAGMLTATIGGGVAQIAFTVGVSVVSSLVILGVTGQALSLLNSKFLTLYNVHTHPHGSGPGFTGQPTEIAVEGEHTTVNVKGS